MAIDWELLRKDFQKQRCILLLGPKVSTTAMGSRRMPLMEQLSIYVAAELDRYKVAYSEKSKRNLSYISQRFLSMDKVRRVDLEDLAEDFYEEQKQTDLPAAYQAIAALPVKVIINVNFDNFIIKALREADKTPIVRHYNFQMTGDSRRHKETAAIDIDEITERSPLVYNLIGTLREKESLVLTETDQMEFIRNAVKGDPPIPDEVLSYFDRRKTYLFIGFDMQSWQFRLLLDSMNLNFNYLGKENRPISPQSDNYPITDTTKTFYEENFNFLFLDEKIDDFIQEIKKRVVDPDSGRAHRVYIAFSDNEADRAHLEQLEKQLRPLEQAGKLEVWHTNRVDFGEELNREEKIKAADTIMLLMSSDFLSDDQILDEDLEWAIDEKAERNVNLIPVLVRHCTWRAIRELRSLQVLPTNEKPIADDSWTNADEACFEIAQELKKRLNL
ncbi:MAG: SIR2 family protein [Bacteroidota bacterium]